MCNTRRHSTTDWQGPELCSPDLPIYQPPRSNQWQITCSYPTCLQKWLRPKFYCSNPARTKRFSHLELSSQTSNTCSWKSYNVFDVCKRLWTLNNHVVNVCVLTGKLSKLLFVSRVHTGPGKSWISINRFPCLERHGILMQFSESPENLASFLN